MEERGFRTMESSTPLMMLGLFELLMYIVVPFMGRKLKGNLIYVNIVSSTAWAMMFFIWPSTNATYAIILSFSAGWLHNWSNVLVKYKRNIFK